MARGGYGQGSGIPLHARVRTERPAEESAPRARCPARHCWITAPVDGASPRPGLLVAWRRDGDTWLGRVLYLAELRAGQWAVVDEWLPSACLTGPD